MLLDVWIPQPDGRLVRSYVTLFRLRRIRADANIVAAFAAEILRFGTLYECRLWQFRRGGFFAKGESVLTAGEERYRSFIEFKGVFATLIERAVRSELTARLIEQHSELPLDDQFLKLFEEEREELLTVPKPSFEEAIVIDPVQPKPLHGSVLTFDATIGAAITLKGLRVSGPPANPRLMPPTSAGLSFRPFDLDEALKYEIARRAAPYLRVPPPAPDMRRLGGYGFA